MKLKRIMEIFNSIKFFPMNAMKLPEEESIAFVESPYPINCIKV